MADAAQKPSGNIINVSSSKKPGFYVQLAKKFFTSNEQIELHGLGAAIAICAVTSEVLIRNGFATLKKIETQSVEVNNPRAGEPIRKPKILIILSRSANFNELVAQEASNHNDEHEEDVEDDQ
eukprot:c5547_g1_i1.p1 GENE.c5547_g1_i1~~c5547_g1_i1.p1  ORF type:complete len:144 (+),score=24.43 c5547_g1_i1:66-434(+)